MSEENRKHYRQKLIAGWHNSDVIRRWLNPSVRAVILDGASAMVAFEGAGPIFRTQPDVWEEDLMFIFSGIEEDRKRSYFRTALADCLNSVDEEPDENDPGRNGGANFEHLAMTFLSIARAVKASEVLDCIPGLIAGKFPRSQRVYDYALLTWRAMASGDVRRDWMQDVFCPLDKEGMPLEPRWWPEYSPVLAFGMTIAQPRRMKEFLFDWAPMQDYLRELDRELDEEKITANRRTLKNLATIYYQLLQDRKEWPRNAFATSVLAEAASKTQELRDDISASLHWADRHACMERRGLPEPSPTRRARRAIFDALAGSAAMQVI